jgi:hypothetical protein
MQLSTSLPVEAIHAGEPSGTIGQSKAQPSINSDSQPATPGAMWIPVLLLLALCLAAGYLFWAKVTFHWPFY